MDEGHAFADRAREFEFEVREAVVTHASAEPNYRGLADMRPVGEGRHRQTGKAAGVQQHQFAHTLFGGGQGGQ